MTILYRSRAMQRRWQLLHLHVRCGLSSHDADRVRQYLVCGHRLAQLGVVDEGSAQRRMLQTLLRTARDETLPWFWRSVCLEHVCFPLARLRCLLGRRDPIALQAIEAAVQSSRDELPAPY